MFLINNLATANFSVFSNFLISWMIRFYVEWPDKQNPLQIVENFETSYDNSSPFTLGYSEDCGMIENNFLKVPVF